MKKLFTILSAILMAAVTVSAQRRQCIDADWHFFLGDGSAVLTQRNKFTRGDTLELLLPDREPLRFRAEELRDMDGEELADTRRAMMEFRMRLPAAAPAYAIVRKRR